MDGMGFAHVWHTSRQRGQVPAPRARMLLFLDMSVHRLSWLVAQKVKYASSIHGMT